MKISVHESAEAAGKAAAETAAQILRRHPSCFLFLDRHSASELSPGTPAG